MTKTLCLKEIIYGQGLLMLRLKTLPRGGPKLSNPATTGSFNTANGYQTMLNNAGAVQTVQWEMKPY